MKQMKLQYEANLKFQTDAVDFLAYKKIFDRIYRMGRKSKNIENPVDPVILSKFFLLTG